MKMRKMLTIVTMVALCGCVGGCGVTKTDEDSSFLGELTDAAVEGTSKIIVEGMSDKIKESIENAHNGPIPGPEPDRVDDPEPVEIIEQVNEDYLPQGIYVDKETGEIGYDDSLVDENLLYWQGEVYDYESAMNYWIVVDGDKFILPMSVDEITSMGWNVEEVFSDDEDHIIPGTSVACRIEKNDIELNLDFTNKSKEIVSWEDCALTKINVRGSDWLDRIPEIEVCYGVNFDMSTDEVNSTLSTYNNLRKQDESNTGIQYWDELPENENGYRKYAGMCYVGLFDYDGNVVSDSITLEYLGK